MQNALASGIVDVGVHIATLLATQHIAKLEEKGCKIFKFMSSGGLSSSRARIAFERTHSQPWRWPNHP
jgi:hypothetical protein